MIKMFHNLQIDVSPDMAGMNMYVNESSSPIQLDKCGAYLGPGMVAVSHETTHITRALNSGKLRDAGKVLVEEAKPSKKSKKSEVEQKIEEEAPTEEPVEEQQEELPQEDVVVATETAEA